MEKSFVLLPLYGKYGEGKYAKIDKDDFEKLSEYRWWVNRHGYAYTSMKVGYRQYKNIQMHRFILNESNQQVIIDHRNRDKLDNQKGNLNKTDRSFNAMNATQNNSRKLSKYRGVTYHKTQRKWYTQLKFRGHSYNLGSYSKEEDAAKAWNFWVLRICGDEVQLNDVDHIGFIPKPVRGLNLTTSSKYRGVYKEKGKKNWRAIINFKGNDIHIGYFKDEIEAAAAYNETAAELFGNKAFKNNISDLLNHPDRLEPEILLSVYREFIKRILIKLEINHNIYDESNLDKIYETLCDLEKHLLNKL